MGSVELRVGMRGMGGVVRRSGVILLWVDSCRVGRDGWMDGWMGWCSCSCS